MKNNRKKNRTQTLSRARNKNTTNHTNVDSNVSVRFEWQQQQRPPNQWTNGKHDEFSQPRHSGYFLRGEKERRTSTFDISSMSVMSRIKASIIFKWCFEKRRFEKSIFYVQWLPVFVRVYVNVHLKTKPNQTKQTELVRMEKVAPIGAFISIHKSERGTSGHLNQNTTHIWQTNQNHRHAKCLQHCLRMQEREWERWLIPKSCCRRSFRDLFYGRENRKTEGERSGMDELGEEVGEVWGYTQLLWQVVKYRKFQDAKWHLFDHLNFSSFSLYFRLCECACVFHRGKTQIAGTATFEHSMFNPCSTTITITSNSTLSKEMKCCGCKTRKKEEFRETDVSQLRTESPSHSFSFSFSFLFTFRKRLRLFAFPFSMAGDFSQPFERTECARVDEHNRKNILRKQISLTLISN